MKSISVSEFKAHCHEFVSEVSQTGEGVVLTERGKPTAMVVPRAVQEGQKWMPGQFKHTAKIVGNIVAPPNEPWGALH